MTRDDLFNINAGIARDMAKAIATNCPKASILIVTNPVNSLVPIVATVLKKAGKYDPKKLFGVTTLDVVRAKTFLSEKLGVSPGSLDVPVIVATQASPSCPFSLPRWKQALLLHH